MSRDWYKHDDAPLTWWERVEIGLVAIIVAAGYIQAGYGGITWLISRL